MTVKANRPVDRMMPRNDVRGGVSLLAAAACVTFVRDVGERDVSLSQ